jgi:hypothetical protein
VSGQSKGHTLGITWGMINFSSQELFKEWAHS